ncbi:MAG: DUF2497 domain-containing protein [Kiloniellales bacterium]|nr:DUF2497 domain-containing protein [Kiloniellales bacterium]
MSEPKRDDEPTMEEILASIRKIISEDDPGKVQAAAGDGAADADDDMEAGATQGAESDDAEPMELTQMVSEDGSVVDLRAESQAVPPAVEEPSASEERNAEEAAAEPAAESPPTIVKPLVPEGTRVHAEREGEDDGVPAPEPQEPEAAARDPEVGPEMEPGAEDQASAPDAAAARASRKPEPEGLVSAEATAAATAAMSRLKDRLAAGHMAVGGGDKSLEALARETMAPHLKSWLDRNLPELVERIVREEIEKLVKQGEPR